LLLAFADKVSRSWKQIIYFKPEGDDMKSQPPPAPLEAAPVSIPRGSEVTSDLMGGAAVIEDERGVRLAREQED